MSAEVVSYTIEPDVPSTFIGSLFDFFYQKYLLPQRQRFTNISRTMSDSENSLTFDILNSVGMRTLKVELRGGKPIKVRIIPFGPISEMEVTEAKQDIEIAVEFFEDRVRQNTLYFAWREGETIVPERVSERGQKSINRLFLETQVLLFVLFITLGLFLFIIIGPLVPIVLLAIQFVFVFYSSKFIGRSADWHITEENPFIHMLEYRLSLQEEDEFKKRFSRGKLVGLKKEIYEETILRNGEIDCQTANKIFPKYGISCNPENLATRKVNVYEIVRKTASRFGFPMPEVVVSNTLIPNAAASGPTPGRGIVLITTGLLANLNEDEILSVLGHEFGHLKGRDPLILYGLTSAQFLFTFYVVFAFFPQLFYSLLFLVYYWLVATITYFVAKFFEARADLISAMVMGTPKILAESLEKIGFRRLLYERMPFYRVQEWISFDPHPPIYFRVDRLRKLGDASRIKHPFIRSAKEVTKGFIESLI